MTMFSNSYESRKSIPTEKTLVTIKMDVSFLKSFYVGFVSLRKKSTDCMVCSIHYNWFLWLSFLIFMNSLIGTCLFLCQTAFSVACRWHKQVAPCKHIQCIQHHVDLIQTCVLLTAFSRINRIIFPIITWVRLCICIPSKDTEQYWMHGL